MKHYKIFGLISGILLMISCFLPWAYYQDIDKHFNGFFSFQNMYGKPGKAFIFLAILSVILVFINQVWAKRTLLFVTAVNVAYLIKTFVLFTTCYSGVCPQKEYGMFVLIISVIGLVVATLFPDIKLSGNEEDIPH